MKLENQVTSLKYSKRLKELGVKQESLFYWVKSGNDKWSIIYKTETGYYLPTGAGFSEDLLVGIESYSAFTVAELGEALPNPLIIKQKDGFDKYLFFGSEHIGSEWECGSEKMLEHTFTDKTEANARAKMLIYLLENDLCEK